MNDRYATESTPRSQADGPPGARASMPVRFFWIGLGYLLLLLGAFLAYHLSPSTFAWLPASLGPLPVEVPWFGAVGGALVSLSGVFTYNQQWNARFNYWHYARPVVGAAIGSIGALLFLVAVQAAHSGATTELNPAVFDAVAFLIGYREETFLLLVKRVTDLMLGHDRRTAQPSGQNPAELARELPPTRA